MKSTIVRWSVIALLTIIAAALQAQTPDAQRKEINPQSGGHHGQGVDPGTPIAVQPDAQRKEAPRSNPITVVIEKVRGWASWISAQRKE